LIHIVPTIDHGERREKAHEAHGDAIALDAG